MITPPPFLTGNQIRHKFLQFYKGKKHQILPSASLIPTDPTVLLTIAGMLPFKPIFLGQELSRFSRVTTSQKCIRTNDIDNVGYTARHHTFFEMLGNFSFGDYFKEQAIKWAWELSTEIFLLPSQNIIVSVFENDDEAFDIWENVIGISKQRIIRMGEKDNFWKAGETGPCGPCSELYYDFYPELGEQNLDLENDSRFIEFYNLVFMEYNRNDNGDLLPLEQKNIDTGMGLERMAQILQKVPNNYETDLIFPIIKSISNIITTDYAEAEEKVKRSLKIIGDHTRAVVHMISDGVVASNTDRGYVLRRLIRRIIRHGRLIGIEGKFINEIAQTAIQTSGEFYPEIKEKAIFINKELEREEDIFLKTLERGEKLLSEIILKLEKSSQISGLDAFTLYDTYGFPLELTQEIAEESQLKVNVNEFYKQMKIQQCRSKAAHETVNLSVQYGVNKLINNIAATKFLGYSDLSSFSVIKKVLVNQKVVPKAEKGDDIKIVLDQSPFYAESGGQVSDHGHLVGQNSFIRINDVQKESGIFIHSGKVEEGCIFADEVVNAVVNNDYRHQVKLNHTSTHLLQAALKKILGDSITQAGSLVTFDRLRFDFQHSCQITPEQIEKVENTINSWISEKHIVKVENMPLKVAKEKGAIAMFGEKYGAEVRVINIPEVSMELCGGTHVENIAEIGLFKIISQSGISSGVKRIEAITGPTVLNHLKERENIVKNLCDHLKTKPEEIQNRITSLQIELKDTQKQLEIIQQELAVIKSDKLLDMAELLDNNLKIIVSNVGNMDTKALQKSAERLQHKIGEGAVVLGSTLPGNKVSLVAAFSKKIYKDKNILAGQFIGEIAQICEGGGGGRPNLAQAGGKNPGKLEEALLTAKNKLIQLLK
ncbi:alanine--tRNA ligase [Candidatus Atelocyanobacterium thalassae]|uniref:Alanine--tRNA ligase n=1 Tax=cyanobacterium endosymbiont of Braarudosphaera bigelowii TaxID=1285375 RepID=A0ABM7U688_9CHRO|nr:alanine--tRNA ligase [Candidatus Atelocyanobacterium thalassa]BDA40299.1 alanine--tRNA ligase [cyanobacterium endosymbiont of Braarudosphaera bigelowii]